MDGPVIMQSVQNPSQLPLGSQISSFSSSSASSGHIRSHRKNINPNNNSPKFKGHKSSASCSSIPEVPDEASHDIPPNNTTATTTSNSPVVAPAASPRETFQKPRITVMTNGQDEDEESGEEEFPLRHSQAPASAASSPSLPSPSAAIATAAGTGSSSVSRNSPASPVGSSPNLMPGTYTASAGGSMPRSVSTPAASSYFQSQQQQLQRPNSPYNHHRNFSSNTLPYPHHNSRNSRFSPQPFSSHSSVSSLDFNAPGVMGGGEVRSHSPAVSELAGISAFDLNQSFLTANLSTNSSSLMPRIKTIELYRKNAKKSNDPLIQFQFAQYMLQTALLSGTSKTAAEELKNAAAAGASSPPSSSSSASSDNNLEVPTMRHNFHGSSHSLSSFTAPPMSPGPMNGEQEKKIKHDLLKEAVSHLHKLSINGYADAQYLLGDAYASGALGKSDLKESFLLFQMAAKHGHAEAAYRAALCLEEGWGTSTDARKAVQYLRQASSKSHPGAMLRLGIACFYGRLGLHMGSASSVGKTQQEGIKWLKRATETANETFPQGPFELAKIYETGYKDIVFVDIPYAVQLYVKSADLNYFPASAKLGHAYEYGALGCPQDAALSIHYYTIAALGGDPTAMLAMCAWYMVGAEPMLPRNEEEAFCWAERAAQRGLAKAQYAAGYFLENGIGCERDIFASTAWYRKAAAGGDQKAVERLKNNRNMAESKQTKSKNKGHSQPHQQSSLEEEQQQQQQQYQDNQPQHQPQQQSNGGKHKKKKEKSNEKDCVIM